MAAGPSCRRNGGGHFPREARLSLAAGFIACLCRPSWLHSASDSGLLGPVLGFGEVAERLNAPHSKCGMGASPSGVRIPPSPPKQPYAQPAHRAVLFCRGAGFRTQMPGARNGSADRKFPSYAESTARHSQRAADYPTSGEGSAALSRSSATAAAGARPGPPAHRPEAARANDVIHRRRHSWPLHAWASRFRRPFKMQSRHVAKCYRYLKWLTSRINCERGMQCASA